MSTFDREKEMQRRAEARVGRCRHFTGLMNGTCNAGIAYLSVRGESNGRGFTYPCFGNDATATCDRCVKRTPEEARREVDAEEIESRKMLDAVRKVRDHARERGLRRGNGGASTMPCPKCGTGVVSYSVTSCNGHLHGVCSTPRCLAWME